MRAVNLAPGGLVVIERVSETGWHLEAVVIAVQLRWLALAPRTLGHVRHCTLAQAGLPKEKASHHPQNMRVLVEPVEQRVTVVCAWEVGLAAPGRGWGPTVRR